MSSHCSSFHVGIIGAGPAACATALSLKRHTPQCRVSLFDAAKGPQQKVGETIPPAATPVIRDLIGEQIHTFLKSQVRCPGTISMWGSQHIGYNDYIFDLSGNGYHLDRQEFERVLQNSVIQKGGEIHYDHRLTRCTKGTQTQSLSFINGQQKVNTQVNYVVDASGSANVLSNMLKVTKNTYDEVIFVCAVYSLPDNEHIPRQTMVEATHNGWWYFALLPHKRCIVTFCTDKEQLRELTLNDLNCWSQHLRQSRFIFPQISNLNLIKTKLFRRQASSSILSAVYGSNWLAVGDAASSYDPISSAGITKSLLQGRLAGEAISHWIQYKKNNVLIKYQERVFSDFNEYLTIRETLYRQEIRFAHEAFWRQRLLFA